MDDDDDIYKTLTPCTFVCWQIDIQILNMNDVDNHCSHGVISIPEHIDWSLQCLGHGCMADVGSVCIWTDN